MMGDENKHLGKQPFEYLAERDRFHKELFQFHQSRGSPFLGLPSISGEPVDLYMLYSVVTKLGGFHKLCDAHLWYKVDYSLFHFPESCGNTELALKQLYMRYLYAYEMVHIHGEDPDIPDEEEPISTSRHHKNRSRILVHQVSLDYNYRQHKIDRRLREAKGLSTNIVRENKYDRLEKSLLSGIMNEVDFAMNVCCLLSMEGPDTLRIFSRPQLLEILLAHVGLFSNNSSLQQVYDDEWLPKTKRDFRRFWYETTDLEQEQNRSVLDLISTNENERNIHQQFYITNQNSAGKTVLNLSRITHNKDPIHHRVIQVLNVIRNLSFDIPNMRAICDSEVCMRLVLLASHNTQPQIKRAALETLTNVSSRYTIAPAHENQSQLLVRCIHSWLLSYDKMEIVNALQIISGLSQVEDNEEIITDCLKLDTYERLFELANMPDLQLIMSSLDSLYYLSEIGEITCDYMSHVLNSVQFLIDYLTVETMCFGEQALAGIQVIEQPSRPMMAPPPQRHLPMRTRLNIPQNPALIQKQHQPMMIPTRPPVNQPQVNTAHLPTRQLPQKSAGGQMIDMNHTPQPVHNLQTKLKQAAGPDGSMEGMLPATPQNLAVMKPEQVVSNWLRANYESCTGNLLKTNSIHKDYCTWLLRKSHVKPVDMPMFNNCLRKIYPNSQLAQNGLDTLIHGIRWKPPPGPDPPSATPPQYPQSNSAPNIPHNVQMPAVRSAQTTALQNILPKLALSPRAGVYSPRSHLSSSPPLANSYGSDILRDMLSMPADKPVKTKRRHSSTGSRRRGSNQSPRELQLQICGEAEKMQEDEVAMSKIERVENPKSPANSQSNPSTPKTEQPEQPTAANQSEQTTKHNKQTSATNNHTERQTRPNNTTKPPATNSRSNSNSSLQDPEKLGNTSLSDFEKKLPERSKVVPSTGIQSNWKELKDTTSMDTDRKETLCKEQSYKTSSLTPPANHIADQKPVHQPETSENSETAETRTNGDGNHKNSMVNGDVHMNGDRACSPAESNNFEEKVVNGVSDLISEEPAAKKPKLLNGLINGIIEKSKLTDLNTERKTQRHPSGDSLGSHASTSTLTSQSSSSNEHSANNPPASNRTQTTNGISNTAPNTQPNSTPVNGPCSIPTNDPAVSQLAALVQKQKSAGQRSQSSSASERRSSVASRDSSERRLVTPVTRFVCGWDVCTQSFNTAPLLRGHISKMHTHKEGACLWAGCDRTMRKRWSLVSHVAERHTNDAALSRSMKSPSAAGSLPHPPPLLQQNSKLAIMRAAPKPPYHDLMDKKEGPVTKHIRFTSALILRNMSRYSSNARMLIRRHESRLSSIAASSMESSGAILNTLWEIQ